MKLATQTMRTTLFPSLLQLSRRTVTACLERRAAGKPQALVLAVDGTCGNGHDTLFLAATLQKLAVPHSILAFDVQQAALEAAQARLSKEQLQGHATLLLQGHDTLGGYLARHFPDTPVATAMYNLGFLPGSDKQVATSKSTTLVSLEAVRDSLAPRGILSVHAYGGHAGGHDELEAVDAWFSALPFAAWTVSRYTICNKDRNPEVLFLAEKKDMA